MNAREITTAMRGRWSGHYGMVCCPAHKDSNPSCRIRDGENGQLLVRCYAGCAPEDILRALRSTGVLRGEYTAPDPDTLAKMGAEQKAAEQDRSDRALVIWRECKPVDHTPAEIYLRSRGITLNIPPSLKFHTALSHADFPGRHGGMVAGVQNLERKVVAIHRTYLTPQGQKKFADQSKLSFGPLSRHAVRLAPMTAEMAIGEGIETCLSFMQLTGIPTWAALSTGGVRVIDLPPIEVAARVVRILVDNDPNGAGQVAADRAAERFRAEGRAVHFERATSGFKDFNDQLRGERHAAE